MCLATVTAYISAFISPDQYWQAGILALSIPTWLLINVGWLVFWLALKKWKHLRYSAITLLVGYRFCLASFSVSLPFPSAPDFTVLSQNVRVFNSYRNLHKNYVEAKEAIRWVTSHEADIKCFQEYFHYEKDQSGHFSTNDSLSRNGEYHSYVCNTRSESDEQVFGLAIFSRFPIVKKGRINIGTKIGNAAIFADVKIKDDTIRVINVHLQSLKIDEEEAATRFTEKSTLLRLGHLLRYGFEKRAFQIAAILNEVESSPHPVIVCGDFNDTPYSYAYQSLRNKMGNAFEAEGNGFGFTFNGKLPFLRIDHQFFSHNLVAEQFETCNDARFSDHFPTLAGYSFR